MKKIILIILVLTSVNIYAQKDSKKTYYYYNQKFGEQYGVNLTAKNIVSTTEYVKLGLEIINDTESFLLFEKDKCKFVVDGNSYFPRKKKKGDIIFPNSKRVITVKSAGETNYLTEDIDFKPGGFYTFSAEGKVVETEPFHLPPNRNEINNGIFKINMLKLKKQTDETVVQFRCTYTGDKIGLIKPSNCVLRTENGKEWATVNSKEKIKVLQKNDKVKFTVTFKIPGKITDMQFAEMDIVWKNTFSESELKQLNFDIQHFNLDRNKTKNK